MKMTMREMFPPVANHSDSFDLDRFVAAQEGVYETALAELRSGRKRTHWIWFIFPQVQGLGNSAMSIRFAIKSRDEARHYLKHPVLGRRLQECADAVLVVEERSVSDIFGYPDDLKLKSSMALFASVAEPGSVFARILEKYFQGEPDSGTLEILETMKE